MPDFVVTPVPLPLKKRRGSCQLKTMQEFMNARSLFGMFFVRRTRSEPGGTSAPFRGQHRCGKARCRGRPATSRVDQHAAIGMAAERSVLQLKGLTGA